MKLVHKLTGKEVKVDDEVSTFRNEKANVLSFAPPNKASSEGKVTIAFWGNDWVQEVFAGVVGTKWIEREDRGEEPALVKVDFAELELRALAHPLMNITHVLVNLNKLDDISTGLHKVALYGDYTGEVTNDANPDVNFIFDTLTECNEKLDILVAETLARNDPVLEY